jgi:hypothetical protein
VPAVVPVLGAVVLGAVLLAACSSNSSSSTTTGRSTTTASPSTSSSGPSAASTTPGSTTPGTTTPGTTTCATGALTASVVGSSGAAGTIETTVALKSTSTSPCVLSGYPGLQLLGTNGAALATTVVRKGNYGFTAMAPTTVTLTDGQSAFFNIGYSDVPAGTASCPSSTSLSLTPPNALDHVVVQASLSPCGAIAVSPVFLATGSNTQTTAPPAG